MGLFDINWIVDFEYKNSFIASYRRATMVVRASNENGAKYEAKAILKREYTYFNILGAHKSSGRQEERKASFQPTKEAINRPTYQKEVSQKSASYNSIQSERKPLTQEEIDERKRYAAELRKEREQKQKIEVMKKKQAELKSIRRAPVITLIVSSIISVVAFVFGWIPHWIFKAIENRSIAGLQAWISLGHSETDEYGQQLVAQINTYHAKANGIIWLPFVILGLGIAATIVSFVIVKKKQPGKLVRAVNEFKALQEDFLNN